MILVDFSLNFISADKTYKTVKLRQFLQNCQLNIDFNSKIHIYNYICPLIAQRCRALGGGMSRRVARTHDTTLLLQQQTGERARGQETHRLHGLPRESHHHTPPKKKKKKKNIPPN